MANALLWSAQAATRTRAMVAQSPEENVRTVTANSNDHIPRNVMGVPAVVALIALVLSFAPIPAAAQTTHFSMPVAGPTANPCNGDPVVINGITDVTFNTTADGAGGLHVTMHSVSKGDGFGVSGVQYLFSEEQTLVHEMSGPSDADVKADVLNTILNGTGPTDNFLMKWTVRVTISGDGIPRSPVVNVVSKCTG